MGPFLSLIHFSADVFPPLFNRCYYEEGASSRNTNPSFDAVLKDYSDAWVFPGIKIARRSVSTSNKAFPRLTCHKETEKPCHGCILFAQVTVDTSKTGLIASRNIKGVVDLRHLASPRDNKSTGTCTMTSSRRADTVAKASGALEEKRNDAALTCTRTSLAHTSTERQLRRLQRAHFTGMLARSALHWIWACPSTGSISPCFYLSFWQRNVFSVGERGDGGVRGKNGQEKSRSEDDKKCRKRRGGFGRGGFRVHRRRVRYEQPLGIWLWD